MREVDSCSPLSILPKIRNPNTLFQGCAVVFHQVHCEQKLSLARAKELSTFRGCRKRSNREQRDQKESCGITSPLYEYCAVLPHYSEPLLLLLQTQQGWSLPHWQ